MVENVVKQRLLKIDYHMLEINLKGLKDSNEEIRFHSGIIIIIEVIQKI
jgi:hypothetical protein